MFFHLGYEANESQGSLTIINSLNVFFSFSETAVTIVSFGPQMFHRLCESVADCKIAVS